MENEFLKTDINSLGVDVVDGATQFERATDAIKSHTPNGIVPNAGLAGQLLNGLAQSSFQQSAQAQEAVMGALTLSAAVGVQVENLLLPLGITRLDATFTQVELMFKNNSSASQTIPAHTLILNITTQDTYQFAIDISVPANSTINAPVIAQNSGAIVCPANSKWSMMNYVDWIGNITNPSSGELGLPLETDFMYKYRHALYAGQQQRSGSYSQILKILDTSSYVENYQVIVNSHFGNFLPIEYASGSTFSMPPSSYLIAIKLKDSYNTEHYFQEITKSLGGNRIQIRMVAPVDATKQVIINAQNTFTQQMHLKDTDTYTIGQIFYANYTITLPKYTVAEDGKNQANYYLGLRVKYTQYFSTPPIDTLLIKVQTALYNNFYGVFQADVPVPTPDRILLGSTITAERFQVSLQALNVIGLETTPQLLEYDHDETTGEFTLVRALDVTNLQFINTLICENWRLLPNLISLDTNWIPVT